MCVCCSSMWCNPWSSCCCRGKMRGLPFLPWLPLAARCCRARLRGAARARAASAFQNSPGHEEGERSAGSISPRTVPCRERELGPEGAPQTETRLLCPRVKPKLAPVLWEPLKGTSSPCALPSSVVAGPASPVLLRQSSPGPGVPQLLGQGGLFSRSTCDF